MSLRALLVIPLLAILATSCRTSPPPPQVAQGPTVIEMGAAESEGDAYIGLSLRDYEEGGTVVSWVLPGPLEGTGFRSPYLSRGDLVLAVDGTDVTDADHFSELIKQYRPGDTIQLKVNLTEANLGAAVPTPGETTNIQEIPVTLVAKHLWTGPIYAPYPADRQLPAIIEGESTALERYLREQLQTHELTDEVTTLIDLFEETVEERGGYHMLSRVSYGFRYPMHFPELVEEVSKPFRDLHRQPAQLLRHSARNLDIQPPELPQESVSLADPQAALAWGAWAITRANRERDLAFANLTEEELAMLPPTLRAYMSSLSPFSDNPASLITAMRATMRIDFPALFRAAAILTPLMDPAEPPPEDTPVIPTPEALADLVTGDLLAAFQVDGQWYVYGGFGPNEYQADRLALIIDAGGDDTYIYGSETQPPVHAIVDLAGDDTYRGDERGPASATLGVSLLVDHAGDDQYEGGMQSVGSCLAGIAILLDRAGNDRYTGTSWSLGSAFYGLGAIVDLHGHDTYWAHHASQGIGGPRGLGIIYDRGGNDLYRANGPTGSGYGTPAVYYGLSQGVGFGVRGFDSGGIGIISDRGGHDRYEAGEFSQGGGYYWGLGIIDEGGGNDLYYGNRYSQGFGCHQALGALVDHHGNDTYWAMTAACQGAAWDIGMGLLSDHQGNDTYSAPGLSQGGAAMQGIAWFIDWQGDDHYVAGQHATHGMGGGNAYHYDRTKAMSWALFLDAGGTQDFYSTERENGTTHTTGTWNEEKPENSRLHGLFIDTQHPLTLD